MNNVTAKVVSALLAIPALSVLVKVATLGPKSVSLGALTFALISASILFGVLLQVFLGRPASAASDEWRKVSNYINLNKLGRDKL